MAFYPHAPRTPESEAEWFQALIDLARYLRSPEGCPWDREQTARTFAHFSKEEAAELDQAFESGDKAEIEEEFGDTLFTLLASAAAAEEEGLFTLQAALEKAHEKMIRRHDHVFGHTKAATPQDAIDAWNRIKAKEKGGN
jgi:uncharacterized protein YabN with tetrapyrrole methylase and pyrophosphatase domain